MVFLWCIRFVGGQGGGVQNDLDATLGPRHYAARGSGTAAAVCPSLRLSSKVTTGASIHHVVTHLSS